MGEDITFSRNISNINGKIFPSCPYGGQEGLTIRFAPDDRKKLIIAFLRYLLFRLVISAYVGNTETAAD